MDAIRQILVFLLKFHYSLHNICDLTIIDQLIVHPNNHSLMNLFMYIYHEWWSIVILFSVSLSCLFHFNFQAYFKHSHSHFLWFSDIEISCLPVFSPPKWNWRWRKLKWRLQWINLKTSWWNNFIRTTHRTFPTLLIVQHRSAKKAKWKKLKNEKTPTEQGETFNSVFVGVFVYECVCESPFSVYMRRHNCL